MSKDVKIIRVNKGEEVTGALKVAAVYNDLPAGVHAGRASVTGAGDDVVFTIHLDDAPGYSRNMEKKCMIIRAAKGKEAEAAKKIADIYNSLEDGEVASRTISVSAGGDVVYVLFTDVYPEVDEDDEDDEDDDAPLGRDAAGNPLHPGNDDELDCDLFKLAGVIDEEDDDYIPFN